MGEVNLGQVAALIQSVGIETLPEGATPTVRNTGTKANADLVFGLPATITTAQVKKLIEGSETGVSALVDESLCRNLLDVLGIRTVHSDEPASKDELKRAMKILHDKINADGNPNWHGLRLGDYLDLPELHDGETTYKWSGEYKNLRIMISAFNLYKNAGFAENTKNHIVFTFRNCVCVREMHDRSIDISGYPATKMAAYLDNGFKRGLEAVLGNYLYRVSRLFSTVYNNAWKDYAVFIPTEREVWGTCVWGERNWDGFHGQIPIFRDSVLYKVKRYNGSRHSWWSASPRSSCSSGFCYCDLYGAANTTTENSNGGVAPVFCVA